MSDLMFFHGLESGPVGRKSIALRERFPAIEAPDFRGRDLPARMRIAEEATRDRRVVIVGSSFGGLVAVMLASAHPDRVAAYVLCAPAIHPSLTGEVLAVPARVRLLHGTADEVIPIEVSRMFAAKWDVPLIEVDDGHRLDRSMDRMIALTAEVLA